MTEFKIVPDQYVVDAMGRDLRFHPSHVTEPATLTLENVVHFNKNGFVQPIRIFDGSEADDLRAYFDRLLKQAIAEGQDSYSISTAHLKYGRVYDLLTHPRIVACVQDLLGPEVVGWGSHFFCKMPRDGKRVAWHQDASYWPMEPRINMTAWIALGPTFPENGCLRLIPGSHKQWLDDEYQPLDNASQFNRGLSAGQVDESKAVDVAMQPGEVAFFTEATLHGSNNNSSDVARLGFSGRYTTPEVKFDVEALKEQNIDYLARTTLVRGEDKYNYNEAIRVEPPAK